MKNGIIDLDYGDYLVIDPCYIKKVIDSFSGDDRYDALKCVKTLPTRGDGMYFVKAGECEARLGVDSGRIWVMQAEFDCAVCIEAGISGYMHIGKDEVKSLDDFDAISEDYYDEDEEEDW